MTGGQELVGFVLRALLLLRNSASVEAGRAEAGLCQGYGTAGRR
jgi:hypothetical protein